MHATSAVPCDADAYVTSSNPASHPADSRPGALHGHYASRTLIEMRAASLNGRTSTDTLREHAP